MFRLHGRYLILIDRLLREAADIKLDLQASGAWETYRSQELSKDELDKQKERLSLAKESMEMLACSHTLRAMSRLEARLEATPPITFEESCSAFVDIAQRFSDEMDVNYVFCTTPDAAAYWGRDDHVSEVVRAIYPEAAQEIRLAGSSYSCGLFTASVFHSMRAAEGGLRKIAGDLGVTITETDGMKIVVDGIRTAANKIDQEPRSPDKHKRSQHYSEVAIEAGLFKDAWRNHVAHAKVSYQAEQALQILQATCRFFEKIVKPI
jgi:hypothetical protein